MAKYPFQPTRPLRGATELHDQGRAGVHISTHAPLAGRDVSALLFQRGGNQRFQPTRPLRGATEVFRTLQTCVRNFNPRAPCGARQENVNILILTYLFQPTRPLRGATTSAYLSLRSTSISTHAPLAGRDMNSGGIGMAGSLISTHAPLAGRDSKSVQITMHIFAITDKFQMLLHRMPPVRAFCSFLMQENHADFGCEPPK